MHIHTLPEWIAQNVPLAPRTTLGVGGTAEYFAHVTSEEMLHEAVSWAEENAVRITVLGGGSNVLVNDAGVKGLVLNPDFTGMTYEEEDGVVYVHVGAGVSFDTCVAELVEKKLWGIENLSAIPGTVGATPVQNVGAYGVEVSDVIASVRVYDTNIKKIFEIKNAECNFAYRDSIFKHDEGAHYIIISVTLRCTKEGAPKISYKDLAQYFEGKDAPTISEVRSAVMEIRSKKFPNWLVEGTAGSFFKNPIIPEAVYTALIAKYPALPGYSDGVGNVKVSLGWILEHACGLKGYAEGDVRLFEKQALVLVCTKGISATEVEKFSQKIIDDVYAKVGIHIEREVRMIA